MIRDKCYCWHCDKRRDCVLVDVDPNLFNGEKRVWLCNKCEKTFSEWAGKPDHRFDKSNLSTHVS